MNDKESLALQGAGMTTTRLREATDVANVCREIVEKTAVEIFGKKHVCVEGWTSIAVAHGCIASIKENSVGEVLRGDKVIGIRAIAELRRQLDGVVLSLAEGFVGADELDWFGSHGLYVKRWNSVKRQEVEVVVDKRDDYAIRSMAQTRAISRVCRTAFSHVVVMMKAGLSTTPYEEVGDPLAPTEVPPAAAADAPASTERAPERKSEAAAQPPAARPVEVPRDPSVKIERQFDEGRWKEVRIHFGTNKDKKLGELARNSLVWYCYTWEGKGKTASLPSDDDKILRAACNVAIDELGLTEPHN
jgi:hypothetical protein